MKYMTLHRWFVVVPVVTLVMTVGSPALADCPCVTQASSFAGGDGTPGNPYQVCLPAHLDNIRNHMNSHFLQTMDIDMGAFGNFVPIGIPPTAFAGTFHGNNFEIQNLVIDQSTVSRTAVFSMTSAGSIIENVNLVNITVVGRDFVAGLVALGFGSIRHSSVLGTFDGRDIIGGLVGSLEGGSIETSSSIGIVNGEGNIGGLVGRALSGTTITNSYSNAAVAGSGLLLGGLAGAITATTISNCYSSGLVLKEPGFAIGGLIGIDNGGSTITFSFWDTESSNQPSSAGGTGKTTTEMWMQSTFDPPWDFTNIWMIDEGNDYPRLQTPTLSCSLDCQCHDSNDCNGLETCSAGSCVNGTPIDCTSFDDVCAIGTCNPNSGLCQQDVATPSGSTCRAAANGCDVAETCDGINPTCPANECVGFGLPCDNGGTLGSCDGNCTCTADPPVPAVSQWGLDIMLLLTLTAGTIAINHQRRSQAE